MRRIVIAASVANRIEFILDTIGYNTPAFRLFLGFPVFKSTPQYFKSAYFGLESPCVLYPMCRALNFEMSSVASLAAFTVNVLGIIFKASLNSVIAICYLIKFYRSLANWSKWMLSAMSTAPPPATIFPDSRVLLATQIESCSDLN